jgi:hypothetical protein
MIVANSITMRAVLAIGFSIKISQLTWQNSLIIL